MSPPTTPLAAARIFVLGATLQPDATSVRLTTTLQPQGTPHLVTVSGVQDAAFDPNTIADANQASFTSWVQSRGYALRETYLNLPGTTLEDLRTSPKFPDQPDDIGAVTAFEAPVNVGENYGVRLSALLIPPTGGTYQLFIASDDQGELWLSQDASPASATLVAWEPAWNNPRAWTTTFNRNEGAPENRSGLIPFEGNYLYHLTGLMKEGGGGDHLAATWQLPTGHCQSMAKPPSRVRSSSDSSIPRTRPSSSRRTSSEPYPRSRRWAAPTFRDGARLRLPRQLGRR